jgi:hypothetical protein
MPHPPHAWHSIPNPLVIIIVVGFWRGALLPCACSMTLTAVLGRLAPHPNFLRPTIIRGFGLRTLLKAKIPSSLPSDSAVQSRLKGFWLAALLPLVRRSYTAGSLSRLAVHPNCLTRREEGRRVMRKHCLGVGHFDEGVGSLSPNHQVGLLSRTPKLSGAILKNLLTAKKSQRFSPVSIDKALKSPELLSAIILRQLTRSLP